MISRVSLRAARKVVQSSSWLMWLKTIRGGASGSAERRMTAPREGERIGPVWIGPESLARPVDGTIPAHAALAAIAPAE